MKCITLILGLWVILNPMVNASVITGSNIVLSNGGAWADYMLTIYQDEARTDPTSIWLDLSGSTLSLVYANIDEGSNWYLTRYNEAFSEDTIASGIHPVFLQHQPFQLNDIDVDLGGFYLGVKTSLGVDEVYGWVSLYDSGGGLQLYDSAVAYGGTGIYIGTTTQIPEPSTILLSTGGGLFLYTLRSKRTRQGRSG